MVRHRCPFYQILTQIESPHRELMATLPGRVTPSLDVVLATQWQLQPRRKPPKGSTGDQGPRDSIYSNLHSRIFSTERFASERR